MGVPGGSYRVQDLGKTFPPCRGAAGPRTEKVTFSNDKDVHADLDSAACACQNCETFLQTDRSALKLLNCRRDHRAGPILRARLSFSGSTGKAESWLPDEPGLIQGAGGILPPKAIKRWSGPVAGSQPWQDPWRARLARAPATGRSTF